MHHPKAAQRRISFIDEPRNHWPVDLCDHPLCGTGPSVTRRFLYTEPTSAHARCDAADEGGETRMSGGIPWITLPAGYLGSSLIGACLIACGFDTNASKVACLVLAVFFLFTLWWARKNWLYVCHDFALRSSALSSLCDRTWVLILGMSGVIVMFWFVAQGVALRYFVRIFLIRGRRSHSVCVVDPVYRRDVGFVCSLGRDWSVWVDLFLTGY